MFERLLLVLIAVTAFQSTAHSASFVFGFPVNVEFDGSQGVAVADVNGDGRDDLVAVAIRDGFNSRSGYLEVFLQRDDGSLAPALTLKTPSHARTVKGVRLPSDDSDALLVGHEHGLAVYRWNGGGFSLDNRPGEYACLNMAAADLDADGATDVVCLGYYADAMLFYGDPVTGFEPPRHLQTAAMGAGGNGQAQLKDVTGDGRLDLLLAAGQSNSFFVYPNDGSRGFLPAVAYPYPLSSLWSSAIEAVDVDHDGANEVFVSTPCNMPCAMLHSYRQGTHGYLELSKSIPTLDIPSSFLVTDVDSDGLEDLLVAHRGWFTIGRYMGRPQALLPTELWSYVSVQKGAGGLAVGDLNHDGELDMAVANSFGVSVLYGGLQAASDFNNDFTSDLVWRSRTGENEIWISADSTTPQSVPQKPPSWAVQAIGDFDGDAQADLFWRDQATGANEIWSAASALFPDIAGVPGQDWQVVGAGDFDGDDRSDLLWRNFRTGANSIWRSGNRSLSQATAPVADQRWKVVGVGDFDGDDRADILWRHAGSGSNVIWLLGRRELSQVLTAVTNPRWAVAGVGDFDGDGRDDVVWRNSNTGANTIWLSANDATVKEVAGVPNRAWSIAAVADYNGDGRADLMWRNGKTGANAIWPSADRQQSQAITAVLGWDVVP